MTRSTEPTSERSSVAPSAAPAAASRWQRARLAWVVAAGGGILMALEILASRVLAPEFGSSVYVWGSIISVFGERLSNGERIAAGTGLPNRLNAVELRLDNLRLPLYYVSPGQINAQLPFDVPIRQLTLTVYNADHPGGAFRTPALVDSAPGIFSFTSDGQGQGAVRVAGTGLIARAPFDRFSRPARRGETVEIYCTGLGRITDPPPLGQPTPVSPLFHTPVLPIVTIGGARANVSFSGLAPNFVGIYQVNAIVPMNATTGAFVPLSLRMGTNGPESNTVTIAVE